MYAIRSYYEHLEKRSLTENQSQLFIETPYRNNALVDDIINACMPERNNFV